MKKQLKLLAKFMYANDLTSFLATHKYHMISWEMELAARVCNSLYLSDCTSQGHLGRSDDDDVNVKVTFALFVSESCDC